MPTLSAMFRLMDGYSSQINKIIDRTDRAMTKMLGASKAADKVNDSMVKAGKGAAGAASGIKKMGDGLDAAARKSQKAESGLRKLIGAAASLAAVKKVMDSTDTYTNTRARLGMVTGSEAERDALQQDVFAAAGRSRGDYTEMANAAAKLRMLAGDTFSGAAGNQEAVAFTELLTKSLKVSGAGAAEQNSAFLQLTQAMTSGKLQGDEFRSVMENAPMVADAIASYMGKSKAELKELSSEGVITADIIKGAMFQAADDINARFESMPPTFSDTWQKIKNAGTRAFGGIFARVNEMLNSDMGQSVVNNLTGAIYMAAGAANLLLDAIGWVGSNLDVIGPIILGLAAAWAVYNATAGISWLMTLKNASVMALKATADWAENAAILALIWAQDGFNAALAACPITWIISAVILLVAAFYAGVAAVNHFAGTSISATGLIVGALFAAGALIGNLFIAGWNFLSGLAVDVTNAMLSLAEFFANFLNNPVLAIMNLIADLANFVIGVMQSLASVIDSVFGLNLANTVGDWSDSVNSFKQEIANKGSVTFDRIDKSDIQLNRINYSDAFDKGYGIGAGAGDKISGLLTGFNPGIDSAGGMDLSQFATGGSPATVKGTGKGGAVKVENEEDIEWMRKLAERDYVARISQNTLAPNIRVEFSGPITKEADTDGVMAHVVEELKDIIATSPEGVPT